MAKIEISRRKISDGITLVFDIEQIRREFYGAFQWRLRTAKFFMKCAAKVLGTKVEINS